jgi:hypothetical protein
MPTGAFKRTSVLLAILACTSWALGQQAKPVYRGEWKGTAGPAFMHGRWAGQADTRNPDLAGGSWTLQGERGDTILEGTWSARKLARAWRGTWTARTSAGRSYGGSWTAEASGLDIKTFADLLQQTMKAEVAGAWRSGQYFGGWQLRAFMAGK